MSFEQNKSPSQLNLPSFSSTFHHLPRPVEQQYQQQPSSSITSTVATSAAMASNGNQTSQIFAPMAPPPPRDPKKLQISSLMSPPDPVQDSFHSNHNSISVNMAFSGGPSHFSAGMGGGDKGRSHSGKHPLPMSPPISPYSAAVPHSTANVPTTPPSHTVRDPVLYPGEDGTLASPPQAPLFAPAELEDHRRIVEEHVRTRSPSLFTAVSPPKHEDYVLALYFCSQVMKHYTADRKGWLRKEREFLEADRRAGVQRYHAIMPAKPMTIKSARSRGDRVSKPGGGQTPRSIRASNGSAHVPARTARRVSATPEPSRRIVAPNREDKDFNSLPDYCPPLSSLPSRANSLKVDWKGQPIDLSGDPHVNMLHPDEVALAGNLRLDCATYLTSKRRIFERRLQCLRTGKEFRKTDAQQACKIDVNKASKLWTAFDKVGWLSADWVRRFV